MLNKIQLNDAQIALAKQWLPTGSHPYGYNPDKCLIWYWQNTKMGPVKNALKLDLDQRQQLDQLAD